MESNEKRSDSFENQSRSQNQEEDDIVSWL
jgi:hypothetical protein